MTDEEKAAAWALVGPLVPLISIDVAAPGGDVTALWPCPHCGNGHRFEGPVPAKCPNTGKRFNWPGLYVVPLPARAG